MNVQDWRVVVGVKEDPSLVLGGTVYLGDTGGCCRHLTGKSQHGNVVKT